MLQPAWPSWVSSSSRRRSTTSATAPPPSAKMSVATSCTMDRAPTARKSPVSTYTWYGIATSVNVRPTVLMPCPIQSSRNSRSSRSGAGSTSRPPRRRRGEGGGSLTGPSCHRSAGVAKAPANIRQTMYTIKEASARSGVGAPLIRAWERRYGVVRPVRTPSGYRLYDDATIRVLVAMRSLVASGWTASEAARAISSGEVGIDDVAPVAAPAPAPARRATGPDHRDAADRAVRRRRRGELGARDRGRPGRDARLGIVRVDRRRPAPAGRGGARRRLGRGTPQRGGRARRERGDGPPAGGRVPGRRRARARCPSSSACRRGLATSSARSPSPRRCAGAASGCCTSARTSRSTDGSTRWPARAPRRPSSA